MSGRVTVDLAKPHDGRCKSCRAEATLVALLAYCSECPDTSRSCRPDLHFMDEEEVEVCDRCAAEIRTWECLVRIRSIDPAPVPAGPGSEGKAER